MVLLMIVDPFRSSEGAASALRTFKFSANRYFCFVFLVKNFDERPSPAPRHFFASERLCKPFQRRGRWRNTALEIPAVRGVGRVRRAPLTEH
jgi:hypothetical protein